MGQFGIQDRIFEPRQTCYLMLAISIMLIAYAARANISRWHIVLTGVFLLQSCCSVLFWSTFDRMSQTNRLPTSQRSTIHVVDAMMARLTFCFFLYYVFIVGELSNATCYSFHQAKLVRRFKRFFFSIALCGCGYNIMHSHKSYNALNNALKGSNSRFGRIRDRHMRHHAMFHMWATLGVLIAMLV